MALQDVKPWSSLHRELLLHSLMIAFDRGYYTVHPWLSDYNYMYIQINNFNY